MNDTSVTPVETEVPAPGMDLIDGLMSIVFAPGRGIVKQVNPAPTMKDLPTIIGLSLAFWGGAWWLYHKYMKDAPETPLARKVFKPKPRVEEIEDEDEE